MTTLFSWVANKLDILKSTADFIIDINVHEFILYTFWKIQIYT